MLTPEQKKELLQVLTDLIRIDSSNPPGNEAGVADYIQELLQKNGIESSRYELASGRANVYAELGDGTLPPVLMLSHIDVVPAEGEWKHPAFEAVNDNGTIYGRGCVDTKHLTAMELMTMLWIKRSGARLNRKIILLATADEEGGSGYGMAFLEREHPELLPAGCVLSEGGGFVLTQGDARYRTCTCAEKGRCELTLEASAEEDGAGPWATAAGRLLQALKGVCAYQPEQRLTQPTRAFEQATGGCLEDRTLKNLWEYSTKNCLCVNAFELDAAASDTAKLELNLQYVDGTTQEEIAQFGKQLFADRPVQYAIGPCSDGYTCNLDEPFFRALCEASEKLDPGTKILPMVALGRTDGRFIRKNVFGFSPMLEDLPFSEVLKMVHQCNERITEKSLNFGADVIYQAIWNTAVAGIGAASEEA